MHYPTRITSKRRWSTPLYIYLYIYILDVSRNICITVVRTYTRNSTVVYMYVCTCINMIPGRENPLLQMRRTVPLPRGKRVDVFYKQPSSYPVLPPSLSLLRPGKKTPGSYLSGVFLRFLFVLFSIYFGWILYEFSFLISGWSRVKRLSDL